MWKNYNPVRIYGGSDAINFLSDYVKDKTALLVTTKGLIKRGGADNIMTRTSYTRWLIQTVGPNPDIDVLDVLSAKLAGEGIQCIVSLGGGSAMDSAKALAVSLAAGPQWSLSRYLREDGQTPLVAALPIYAFPTTAGTGAELTPFATIWDNAELKKRSLDSPLLYSAAAFLIPDFTLSLPEAETLWGAMDALSHSMETLWNKHSTVISRSLAREAIGLVIAALPQVQKQPQDIDNRAKLQQASALAGFAISQSRTALAHAISYPLTLHFGIPHGLACTFTLPALTKMVNSKKLWPAPVDHELAAQAVQLVKEVKLGACLLKYCTPAQVYDLVDEMFTPGRADNFILNVNAGDVLAVLQDSLA